MVKVWQGGGAASSPPQTVVGPKAPALVGPPVRKPWGRSEMPGGRLPAVTAKTGSGSELAWNRCMYPLPTTPTGGAGLVMAGEIWAIAAGQPTTDAPIAASMATNILDFRGRAQPGTPGVASSGSPCRRVGSLQMSSMGVRDAALGVRFNVCSRRSVQPGLRPKRGVT